VPSLALGQEARFTLAPREKEFVRSGWVEYRPAEIAVPKAQPMEFEEDVFGRGSVMVLAPCVADETKIRLVARISEDLSHALPYLNAEMRQGSYNPDGPIFTFMEGYRMVALYRQRISVAKADDIVDGWRALEMIRCGADEAWEKREEIEPCCEMRQKPPPLETFKRLPRECRCVFEGEHTRLKDALVEICVGLAVSDANVEAREGV
jgi:ArsR family metal-binding transcriptional regulator